MTIAELVQIAHADARDAGWHDVERNRGELLALIHSEISEALEAERCGCLDDKLTHRIGAEVELADAVIRIADYCGMCGYNLEGAILDKLAYNRTREDHRREARAAHGGKKF